MQTGPISETHASRHGGSRAAGWTWMDLADSQGFVAVGDTMIIGGADPKAETGVRLRQTSGNTSRNVSADNGFESVGTPSDLDAASAPYNMVPWVPEYGQIGVGQIDPAWVRCQGRTLGAIDNVDGAANYVRQHPATSGHPAVLAFEGARLDVEIWRRSGAILQIAKTTANGKTIFRAD